MKCKICGQDSTSLFTKKVLNKYNVEYYRCSNCLFIQTENPHWLEESYASAITSIDVGLVYRNIQLAGITQSVINRFFDSGKKFLDFGGGYGLFVRMMRDRGLDFYRQDKYCENLFAKHFDIKDLGDGQSFEALTAFELFEHLPNPLDGIHQMLGYSKSILFSTELSPDTQVDSWWYLIPEVGQHVSLYHYKSLLEISRKLNLNLYSDRKTIHLLTDKKISSWAFKQMTRPRISALYNRVIGKKTSLLQQDFDFLKSVYGPKA